MLNKIKLENFKCFEKMEINLRHLNVFSGINGMGKSTTIQALLLLKQSQQQGYLQQRRVCLNGEYVTLGTGKDILYEHAVKESIYVELLEDNNKNEYRICYKSDSEVLEVKDPYSDDCILSNHFDYLCAERTSPQVIYPKSSYNVEIKEQLGNMGQYSVHYLLINQDKPIEWDSCDGRENFLKGAVQYWLNEISPNIKIEVINIENTDSTKIGYYYTDNQKSNVFRPTNIGFGVSYVLPVILALIKARKGSVLIIENPEAHLHPKGQRKIGELIARCAANGVQIFIETHSDHVLNGIRLAVKNRIINNDNVGFYFFSKKKVMNRSIHYVESPQINSQGKLDYWPDGFFDEWEKALDEIL